MRNFIAIWFGALVLVTGCGAPVMRNLNQVDTPSAAVVTALIATGATLLAPNRHVRNVEARYGAMVDFQRPIKVPTVPADVLDRLDRH